MTLHVITGPEWVKSLWSCHTIRHQGIWSTSVQGTTCGLTAPSHHLNQCSLQNKCRTADPDWQNLGRSGKVSFFIIYKFWQNCASVRQVSDHILKSANVKLTSVSPLETHFKEFLTEIKLFPLKNRHLNGDLNRKHEDYVYVKREYQSTLQK